MSSKLHIDFVCTGNICRSPMAEVIVRDKLAEEGLADAVTVTSSGIGGWHVGQKADERARAELAAHGYDGEAHRAQQFGYEQEQADLIVAHAGMGSVITASAAFMPDMTSATGRMRPGSTSAPDSR